MKQWQWFVYIVECLDRSYYIGITWHMPNRMEQHASSFASDYMKKHGFKRLVYYEEYEHIEDARKRERQLKGWSRKKKEKLINRIWKKL